MVDSVSTNFGMHAQEPLVQRGNLMSVQVISFDNGGQAILNSLHDLEMYVHQNESPGIQQRRCLRLALRALDRQIVTWPYTHVEVSCPTPKGNQGRLTLHHL